MIENIGRLGANGALVQRRGGDREFNRFFAEFAGAMGCALVKQTAGVGGLRACPGAPSIVRASSSSVNIAPALSFSPIAPLSPAAPAAATGGRGGSPRAALLDLALAGAIKHARS